MNNIITYQLPFTFDASQLQKEVLQFTETEWIDHFNTGYYSGNWSAIPLRSVNGDPKRIFPDPTGKGEYMDTPNLHRCTYITSVVNTLLCDKIDVRLMRLKAGSVIKRHRDFNLEIEDGEVRLHIPVFTNPDLEFYLNDERVVLNEGECWYLNFNLYHSVNNKGTKDRIHLVIDCKVNEWLRALFKKREVQEKR